MTKNFESALQKNFYQKYSFIDLNGLIAIALRTPSMNGIQKLANGYLTLDKPDIPDVENVVRELIALDHFLKKRGVPFFVLLAPSKDSMYDVKFAKGHNGISRNLYQVFFNDLKKNGIEFIDFDRIFEANGWAMEDVFFKTDHHWKPQAALFAAQKTMDFLEKKGLVRYKKAWLAKENYESQTLSDWFLGSHGKRTGRFFAGVDDIVVFHPKFPTKYTYWFHRNGDLQGKKGLLFEEPIQNKDYFEQSVAPNTIYLGWDYQMTIAINENGVNDKTLLLIVDSFHQPWQYFVNTQFKRIVTIDLRHYRDGTLPQFIAQLKPDMVAILMNRWALAEKRMWNQSVSLYEKEASTSPNTPPPRWKA